MKAILIAAALLLATPAQATVIATFGPSSSVVHAGYPVGIMLNLSIASAPEGWSGSFFEFVSAQFYDGMGGVSEQVDTTWGNTHAFLQSVVTYETPGVYHPSFELGYVILHVWGPPREGCLGCFTRVWDYTEVNSFTTTITVLPVPGPLLGTGLPALMTLLAWWLRRRYNSFGTFIPPRNT